MPSNTLLKNLSSLSEVGVDLSNTGCPEYQITVLTHRIAYLSNHIKKHKKDHNTKRGLLVLVSRRKSMMKYLQRKNPEALSKITQKLDIRNTAA